MKCLLTICGKEIPKTRKKSARYCSQKCYYEAKKERSCLRYAILIVPAKELKRNEGLLAFLYSVQLLNKQITADDLAFHNFNFSLSNGEHFDAQKGICKIVGSYAYHINKDKTLNIWKLKQPQ